VPAAGSRSLEGEHFGRVRCDLERVGITSLLDERHTVRFGRGLTIDGKVRPAGVLADDARVRCPR